MWDSNTQTIIIPTPVDYQFIKNSVTATSDLLQCIENDINESRRIIRAKNDNSESYQQLITLLQQDNNVLIERVKVLEEEIDHHEMAMFQSQEAICTDYEDRILLNNSEMDRVISQCNKSLDEREDILRRYNDLAESHRMTMDELSSAKKVIADQQETIRSQSVTINDITQQNNQYIIAIEDALRRCDDYELLMKQLNDKRGMVQASTNLVYSSNNQHLSYGKGLVHNDNNGWLAFNRSSNDDRLSADNMNRLSADNTNRLSADFDSKHHQPIHMPINPGFGRDLASPEDDSMMSMQAYEYDDDGTGYESPLDSITKELGGSAGLGSKRGIFDDYAYSHGPLIDATNDSRNAYDQSRDAAATAAATAIIRGDQHMNKQSSADDYRLEVESTMVDDGIPYGGDDRDRYADDGDDDGDGNDDGDGDDNMEYGSYVPTDRYTDEIVGFDREGKFNGFAYDDEGPSEPFETNYYNTMDDDSEIGHDNAIDYAFGDRDYNHDIDDDGGSEWKDVNDEYDNDSLNGDQMTRTKYHSYDDDDHGGDGDDYHDDDYHASDGDGDQDSTAARLEVKKEHHHGYDSSSSRMEKERRYITVADDGDEWEQLNLEELSRLSLDG